MKIIKKLIQRAIFHKNLRKNKCNIIIYILNIICSCILGVIIFYTINEEKFYFSIEELIFYFSMAFIISIFPQIIFDIIIYLLKIKFNKKMKLISSLLLSIIISLISILFLPIIYMDISFVKDFSFLLLNIVLILNSPQYFLAVIISGLVYRIIFYINNRYKW
jgi:hypothetical protein